MITIIYVTLGYDGRRIGYMYTILLCVRVDLGIFFDIIKKKVFKQFFEWAMRSSYKNIFVAGIFIFSGNNFK